MLFQVMENFLSVQSLLMRQEIPSAPVKEETYLIEGKHCKAKRYYKITKGPQNMEKAQTINYLSTASDNQIRKIFEITYNSTTITLEDCITVMEERQKDVAQGAASEEKNQVKNSSTGEQNQKNKKLVLLKQSIFSSSDQTNKNDKKNIVKNVVNAYLKYLRNVQESNKELQSHVNLLKEMIGSKKFNNQLVTSIIGDQSLRGYFRHFLATEAADWLQRSKIKNKNSYEQALRVYEKLCEKQETEEQRKNANQPSPKQEKNSNNSLSCFRDLENHELEEEIEKFH